MRKEIDAQGIVLAIARAQGWFRVMLDRVGVTEKLGEENLFPTVHAGARNLRSNSYARSARQSTYANGTSSVNLCVSVSQSFSSCVITMKQKRTKTEPYRHTDTEIHRES